ncbi:hypothetical protein J2T05_002423 [Cupriavidus necator]|nr:hypothetical protein [Cupriavidus necator]
MLHELARGGFFDRAQQAVAGVVDQHVDAAEAGHGGLGGGDRLCFVGTITFQ